MHLTVVKSRVSCVTQNYISTFGQVVYMHVPLSTKQYKLVPAYRQTL